MAYVAPKCDLNSLRHRHSCKIPEIERDGKRGGVRKRGRQGADKKTVLLLLRKMPANLNTTKATTERTERAATHATREKWRERMSRRECKIDLSQIICGLPRFFFAI